MLSIFTTHPPRTRTAHLQTLRFDDGASLAWFERRSNFANSPHPLLVAINRLPPAEPTESHSPQAPENKPPHAANIPTTTPTPAFPGPSNSTLGPPLHYHISQDETFHVTEGSAVFYTFPTLGAWTAPTPTLCRSAVLGVGEEITIPHGVVHTFRNASAERDMQVEFALAPPIASAGGGATGGGGVEEAFFRNTWSYRSDVKKAGTERSLLQVLCFNRPVGVVLMLPGCGRWVSWLLGVVGAVVGRWVCGFRGVYGEYAFLATVEGGKGD